MSVCAIMVNRNSVDIVEAVVRHTLWHVDAMIVADHYSDDGSLAVVEGLPVKLLSVEERGFDGPKIKTWLAAEALADGHEWAVIVDNDEIWSLLEEPDTRIADYLASLPDQTMTVAAFAHDHIPTALDDPEELNPVKRIQWRQTRPSARKVAFRLRDDFVSDEHRAWYGGVCMSDSAHHALKIHHFGIRSADQLVRKIHMGLNSFSVQVGMPEGFDKGWNQWKGKSDDEIRAAFRERFWSDDPYHDETLVQSPAPLQDALEPMPQTAA